MLVPGAGGSAWYWHRLVAELERRGHDAVAVDLPADDESAGLAAYADTVVAAVGDRAGRELMVISDDLPAVREELSDLEGARFEANPPVVDLQLLMNADVVIASNSSFSWWGAWLNEHVRARVLVPEHWVGFSRGVESPRGVIPPSWEQVPVVDAPLGAP